MEKTKAEELKEKLFNNKKVGWKNHYGVVRQLDSNSSDYMYRGD